MLEVEAAAWLHDKYINDCCGSNDIALHLETLRGLSHECGSITEFGVRGGRSTVAILRSYPRKYTGYDIDFEQDPIVKIIEEAALSLQIDFKFINADTRTVTIDPTDLLFIDTEHVYECLALELRNSPKVRKYIALHDTETFPDMNRAWREWLERNKGVWEMHSHSKECNGFTVFKRIGSEPEKGEPNEKV